MRDLSQIHRLPVLAGDGVALRPWRLRDAAGVAAMCDDESVSRWMPLMPHPYTLADGEVWVGDAARKWREDRWANYAATDPITGSLMGSCGLRIDEEKESGEIGYLVHRDRRRQGIAAACVALLTDWAFDDLGLGRLWIRADTRNAASRRTIAACGYRFEGVLRGNDVVGGERVDDVLHALMPDDPRPWRADSAADAAGELTPRALGWPRLTDGRVVVRPFEPDDAAAVQAACDDPDVAHWIHLVPTPYSLGDAREFVAESRHRLLLGERARLAVADAETGELLGSVSLDLFADRQAAEIGYWVKLAGAPHGRCPGGGAPRRGLGVRRGRRRAPRAADVPRQRGVAGAGRQARLHARVPAARLPPAGGGQEPRGAGRALPGRQPPAPRRPGAVRAAPSGLALAGRLNAPPARQRGP